MGRERTNSNMEKYTLWLEWTPKPLSSLPNWIMPSLLTIFLFSIGLLVATIWKFYLLYITSTSIYIGLFGIFYAFTFGRMQSPSIKNAFWKTKSIFGKPDTKFLELLDKWLPRLYNNGLYLISSAVVIVSASVFSSVFWPDALSNRFLRFMWFMEKGWYQSPLFPKLLILNLFGVFVFSLITTGARAFFLYIGFVREFCKLRIVVSPKLASIRFRSLSNSFLLNFFHWSVCVSLVIISFSQFLNINIVSIGIVILLTLTGALGFIIPQYCFQKNLKDKQEKLIDGLIKLYPVAKNNNSTDLDQFKLLHSLDRILDHIYTAKLKTHDFAAILKLTGTFLIPIVTVLLRMKGWI